jgi:hypothetical protein
LPALRIYRTDYHTRFASTRSIGGGLTLRGRIARPLRSIFRRFLSFTRAQHRSANIRMQRC